MAMPEGAAEVIYAVMVLATKAKAFMPAEPMTTASSAM
jgi:hypothetical protein